MYSFVRFGQSRARKNKIPANYFHAQKQAQVFVYQKITNIPKMRQMRFCPICTEIRGSKKIFPENQKAPFT